VVLFEMLAELVQSDKAFFLGILSIVPNMKGASALVSGEALFELGEPLRSSLVQGGFCR
jgi:hypothetical protein